MLKKKNHQGEGRKDKKTPCGGHSISNARPVLIKLNRGSPQKNGADREWGEHENEKKSKVKPPVSGLPNQPKYKSRIKKKACTKMK